MRRITLDGLELLEAIDRAGSFSGAGALLNKVTSTVSYAVSKLEGDLAVSLFTRNGPRIQLTAAGQELLSEGRALLQAADDLECRVKRIARGWESELRIALDSLIPPFMLSALLQSFCAVAEGTRVKLMSEALTGTWEALQDNRADLIVAAGDGPSGGGYQSLKVAELNFVFCVAPSHPLAAAKAGISNNELRHHRIIVASDSARRMPARSVGLLRGQDVLAVPDMRSKYALQVAGLGVGFLPEPFVKSALKRGLLVKKAVEEPKPREQIYLAWRSGEKGRALKWWRDALGQPGVVNAYLARVSEAWATDY